VIGGERNKGAVASVGHDSRNDVNTRYIGDLRRGMEVVPCRRRAFGRVAQPGKLAATGDAVIRMALYQKSSAPIRPSWRLVGSS